jgi:cation diffusion facilitator family transporter
VLVRQAVVGGVTGIEMLRYLDPLAGMIVACIIFRMAIMILVEAMRSLMDAAPEKETMQEIINVASTLPDVCEVNWVMARYSGPTILGEIAIGVPGYLSVAESHEISLKLQNEIYERVENVHKVIVHIDSCSCHEMKQASERSDTRVDS